jgi:hypothetical protein
VSSYYYICVLILLCVLIQVQVENSNARSAMEGLAEAHRIRNFLSGIAEDVPVLDLLALLEQKHKY